MVNSRIVPGTYPPAVYEYSFSNFSGTSATVWKSDDQEQLAAWAAECKKNGRTVVRRKIIVLEEWEEI